MSEIQLIDRAAKGDRKAFDQLIEDTLQYCKPFILNRFTINDYDYNDAQQRALVKAWRSLPKFRKACSFKTWFLKILKNEAYSLMRSNVTRDFRFITQDRLYDEEGNDFFERVCQNWAKEDLVEISPLERIEKREKGSDYRGLIDFIYTKLDKNSSTVIKLFFEQRKSYEQISKEIKVPIGTIMSRIFYARKKAQRLVIQFYKQFNLEKSELPKVT